ncbi:hypothetical protein Tco_1430971 [Tanacetum coccineum]
MHMLTKPKLFIDLKVTKSHIGFKNPFYLSQARRKVPTLYDGHTIVKQHDALSVPDIEETLDLTKGDRLKMLAKQNDPTLKDKKVNFTPVNYVMLNKLSEHFVKHFVPQKQLSAEQEFWLPISQPVSEKPPVPFEPVLKKEISRELPPISLVHSHNVLPANNNSLEHDNSESELLKYENDCLIELLISQDLVHIAVNSLAAINDYKKMKQSFVDKYNDTLVLKAELAKKHDMIEKVVYNELLKRCSRLENQCISLEIKLQQSKESFQTNRPSHNQEAPEFKEFFIINDLQAQLKAKNVSIEKLKEHIANLKGKNVVDSVQNLDNSNVVTLKVYKLDLQPISPFVKHNRDAHVDYLKHTQENADILHEIIEHARELWPLDSDLASACMFVTWIQELLVYVSATCPSSKHVSDKLVVVTPISRTRKVRFTKSNDTSKDKNTKIGTTTGQTDH